MHIDCPVTIHPRNTFLPNTVTCLASHPRRHAVHNLHPQHLRTHTWHIEQYSLLILVFFLAQIVSHQPGFNPRSICVQFFGVHSVTTTDICASTRIFTCVQCSFFHHHCCITPSCSICLFSQFYIILHFRNLFHFITRCKILCWVPG